MWVKKKRISKWFLQFSKNHIHSVKPWIALPPFVSSLIRRYSIFAECFVVGRKCPSLLSLSLSEDISRSCIIVPGAPQCDHTDFSPTYTLWEEMCREWWWSESSSVTPAHISGGLMGRWGRCWVTCGSPHSHRSLLYTCHAHVTFLQSYYATWEVLCFPLHMWSSHHSPAFLCLLKIHPEHVGRVKGGRRETKVEDCDNCTWWAVTAFIPSVHIRNNHAVLTTETPKNVGNKITQMATYNFNFRHQIL